MTRYLPIVLGVVLIVGLTIPQIMMTDRLSGTNVTAEQRAELLKNVPKIVGDWQGEDTKIDETVRQTAGAVGAVQRTYRNTRTNETVALWLIVGHAHDISRHTPNICYPSAGFEMRSLENAEYRLDVAGQPPASFLTNTFFKNDLSGQRLERVFWTWYNASRDDDRSTIEWEGPSNPHFHFGNSRALYKMYFSSEMRGPGEVADDSPCLRFAKDFLPVVNKVLAEVNTATKVETTAAEQQPFTEQPAPADTATETPPADAAESSATTEPTKSAAETVDSLFGGAPEGAKNEDAKK